MELVNLDKYERLMFRLGFCGDDEELFYVFTPGNNVALLSKPIGVAQGVLHSVVLSNASFPRPYFLRRKGITAARSVGNITHVDPTHSAPLTRRSPGLSCRCSQPGGWWVRTVGILF